MFLSKTAAERLCIYIVVLKFVSLPLQAIIDAEANASSGRRTRVAVFGSFGGLAGALTLTRVCLPCLVGYTGSHRLVLAFLSFNCHMASLLFNLRQLFICLTIVWAFSLQIAMNLSGNPVPSDFLQVCREACLVILEVQAYFEGKTWKASK